MTHLDQPSSSLDWKTKLPPPWFPFCACLPRCFLHSAARMSTPNAKLDYILPPLNLQWHLTTHLMKSRVLITAHGAHTIGIPHPPLLPDFLNRPSSFPSPLLFPLLELFAWLAPYPSGLCLNVTSSKWPSLATLSVFHITLHASFVSLHTMGIISLTCVSSVCLPHPECNPIRAGASSVLSPLHPQCLEWAWHRAAAPSVVVAGMVALKLPSQH